MSPPSNFFRQQDYFAKAVWRSRDHLIIVACGIRNEVPERGEFEKPLTEYLPEASVIFVRDLSCGWYCRVSVDGLVDWLQDCIRYLAPRMISVMGLSMGGFFALKFGERLRADNVVSLSPQVRIDVAADRRYERFYAPSRPLRDADLRNVRLSRFHVVTGTREWQDVWQALQLRKVARADRIVFGADWEHNTGMELRNRGHYGWLFSTLSGGSPPLIGADIFSLADENWRGNLACLAVANTLMLRPPTPFSRRLAEASLSQLSPLRSLWQFSLTSMRLHSYLGNFIEAASCVERLLPSFDMNPTLYKESLAIARRAKDETLAAKCLAISDARFTPEVATWIRAAR